MKTKNIMNALNDIDFDMIEDAETKKNTSGNIWLKWGSVAACFALIMTAAVIVFATLNNPGGVIDNPSSDGNDDIFSSRYKDVSIAQTELLIEWPWEYKTIEEKYVSAIFDESEYVGRQRIVGEEYIGDALGECVARGYDNVNGGVFEGKFAVCEIKGVNPERLIALLMEERYYVFITEKYDPPAVFGDVMEEYALQEALELRNFSLCGDTRQEISYHWLSDDTAVWDILLTCADAKYVYPEGWGETLARENSVSFTVSSEMLGIYKVVLQINQDGYLWTNIAGGEYLYDIGKEAAAKIIDYVKDNANDAEYEPYHTTIIGTLTEIGEDYFLIDDSVLCTDENDGIVFKILADDPKIKRCFEYSGCRISVGDTVQVTYTGSIDTENGNIVTGAIAVNTCFIADGTVLIPE